MRWIPGMPLDAASSGIRFYGGSSGGSAPAGNTTTTQTSQPWSAQVPYYQDIFGAGSNLYHNNTPQYFPNSTVQPFNPLQQTGQAAEAGLGLNGSPTTNASGGYLSSVLGGNYLSAGNPYFQSMADKIRTAVTPQIESQFIGGNSMNNPAAAYTTKAALDDSIGALAGSQYQNERTLQSQAALMAPGQQNAEAQRTGLIQDAGNQQQQQAQAELNDKIARWNFTQNLPYSKLGLYQQSIGGNLGGTSALTQPYFVNNTASNGMLGLLGGMGASGLLNAGGYGNSYTNMLPLAGMFGGMMSDRRAKHVKGRYGGALKDLKKLPVSRARYRGDPEGSERPMIMAQDLEKVRPEAVIDGPGFFKHILPAHVVPMLIAGIHELDAKVSKLQDRGQRRRAA